MAILYSDDPQDNAINLSSDSFTKVESKVLDKNFLNEAFISLKKEIKLINATIACQIYL